MDTYMECGHTAQGTDSNNNPVCVICFPSMESRTIASKPDLTGRRAKCAYNHVEDDSVPSDWGLAFFEYLGPGSPDSFQKCKHCQYHKQVHDPAFPRYKKMDHEFEAHGPYEFDRYYDGCFGWD